MLGSHTNTTGLMGLLVNSDFRRKQIIITKSIHKRQVIIEKIKGNHGPDGSFGQEAMISNNGVISP